MTGREGIVSSLFQTHEVHRIAYFVGKLPLQARWALIDGMCKVLILNSVQKQLGSLVRPWPVVLGCIYWALQEVFCLKFWNVYETFKMNKQTRSYKAYCFPLVFSGYYYCCCWNEVVFWTSSDAPTSPISTSKVAWSPDSSSWKKMGHYRGLGMSWGFEVLCTDCFGLTLGYPRYSGYRAIYLSHSPKACWDMGT